MADEPEPYVALPGLYGAPAYARPAKPVADHDRPFDPDDLPIEAYRSEEERAALAGFDSPGGSPYATAGGSSGGAGSGHTGDGLAPHRFTLRALTERVRRPNR